MFSFTFISIGLKVKFLGVDLTNQTATLIDGGNQKVIHTTLDTIVSAVVGVLSKPDNFKNRPVYIHDFFVSQREILEVVEEELGTKFTINHVKSEDLLASFSGMIQETAWGKNSTSAWGTDDDSKALGLKEKDLRIETAKVLKELKLVN